MERNPFDRCKSGYPLELYAGLEFTRDDGLRSHFPSIPMIGMLNGLLPLFDAQVYMGATAQNPSGPWVGTQPTLPELYFNDVTFPTLQKVKG